MDDRALMEVRFDTDFVYDERGRMVRSNERDGRRAPRLIVGCTAGTYTVRIGKTVPDATATRIAGLVANMRAPEDLRIPEALRTALTEALENDKPVSRESGGPVYTFPDVPEVSGGALQVTEVNLEVVRETFPWLVSELHDWWPCFAVVREGHAVSLCFSSRIGPKACEAGVETLPEFRGRGYAAAVTAAWAEALIASGPTPIYSTEWPNLASQGVARRLGLRMAGTDATWI